MKNEIYEAIEERKVMITKMSDYIFDNPELAFKEYKSSKLLEDYLEQNGFTVTRKLGSLETAFRAEYKNGNGGPTIGLLCEYDALQMGHGCAHHMQGPSVTTAAIVIKELYKEKPYKIVVYGTPGEEGGGGKIIMLQEGFIRDIDVALMMHGGPATQVDIKSLALSEIKVIFHGKSSHAALKPEQGRSALDALLLTFQGVEFLREHVLEDTRMHYTILDSGGPSNVVPEKAIGSFTLRSYNSSYLEELVKRFENIVKGASIMTETCYEIVIERTMDSKVPVNILNEVLMENAAAIGAPCIRPAREKTGSTDFGNVTYLIPGSCIRVAFVDEGTSSHSQEFLNAGKTKRGHNAVINGTKILAATIYDLIERDGLLDSIVNEFSEIKSSMDNK